MKPLVIAVMFVGACAPMRAYDIGYDGADYNYDTVQVGPVQFPDPAPAPITPPDARSVQVSILTSGAARLVAQCRSTYGGGAIEAGLTIAPSGQITRLELQGADGRFADCAANALRTTTIHPFVGDAVRVTEAL